MAFFLHSEVIAIEPKQGFCINVKALYNCDYESVLDLMAEMNRLVSAKEWKYGNGMVNETIISESTVLVLQKALASLRIRMKNNPKYSKEAKKIPMPVKELEALMQQVAEESIAQIVVSPQIIIDELEEMKFLSIEEKGQEGNKDSDREKEEVVSEKECRPRSDIELNDANGARLVNYAGSFLAGGSGALMTYLKPLINFAVVLLFWTSMLQMILPKMGGIS
jgi:hypothetical protein